MASIPIGGGGRLGRLGASMLSLGVATAMSDPAEGDGRKVLVEVLPCVVPCVTASARSASSAAHPIVHCPPS